MIGNADRLAIVLAGGGDRVIAWQTGVLAGLAAIVYRDAHTED